MKKIFVTGLVIGISVIVGLAAVEAQPSKRFDPATRTCRTLTFENLREGQDLFRSECKVCHHRGNEEGADFLYTESKSMRAWNRVFASHYPDCADEGRWEELSRQELLQINDYLYANAYDTNDPSCYV